MPSRRAPTASSRRFSPRAAARRSSALRTCCRCTARTAARAPARPPSPFSTCTAHYRTCSDRWRRESWADATCTPLSSFRCSTASSPTHRAPTRRPPSATPSSLRAPASAQCAAPQHGPNQSAAPSPPWAVSAPQLSPPCASSGRAWRPSAARHSSRGAPPGQWHPSHGLSCSSEPPPRSCLSLTAFVHPSQAPRPRRSSVATAASSSRPSFTRRPSRLRRASTAKPWGTWRRRSTVETVVALPRQCPSWAPAPPQGAPGGFGRLGTPRVEARPLGAQPRPQVLELAASKVAGFTAFDLRPSSQGKDVEGKHRIRGDINVLLLGDPGDPMPRRAHPM